jgi:hypothetical protein
MNWSNHIEVLKTDNELICTVCSPKLICEQRVNNAESALQSISFPFRHCELFTGVMKKNRRSEQVCRSSKKFVLLGSIRVTALKKK